MINLNNLHEAQLLCVCVTEFILATLRFPSTSPDVPFNSAASSAV